MPVVVIQPASADARLRQDNPNTNYGTDIGIRVCDVGSYEWGIIKFNLSSIPPGSTVISATLSIYHYAEDMVNGDIGYVYRVLRAWVEAQVTYNIYSTGNAWQTPGGIGPLDIEYAAAGNCVFTNGLAGRWRDFTLNTAALEGMIDGSFSNNGWLLGNAAGTSDAWAGYSSNYAIDTNLRPKLTVDYVEPLGRLPKYRVNAIEAKAILRTSLDRMINKIWVRYEETTLKRSTAQNDTASQARYGTKEAILSGGQITTGVANQAAKTYLNFTPDPSTPDVSMNVAAGVIRDQNEDRIPPEEVRPNNWGVIEGLPRPTSSMPSSLLQDPRMFYIEEVEYDEDAGTLSIRSGRDRFAETLVNRLLGRS